MLKPAIRPMRWDTPWLMLVGLLLLTQGCQLNKRKHTVTAQTSQPGRHTEIFKAPRPGQHNKTSQNTRVSQATPPIRRSQATWTPLSQRFTPIQTFAFIIPQLPDVAAVGPARAENCRSCHTEIYQEWKQSTHAAALRDLQYQAELSKPSSPRWLCLNCHIPVQNQRKYIIRYLQNNNVFKPVKEKNPKFDPAMRKEAITCAACHVRRDQQGKSYIIGAIGSKHAPHPVKQDRALLRKVCLRCHDPQGERLTKHLVCWFKTREELARGPDHKKDCVDCHMPTKQRRLVPAWKHLPMRTSHTHHWVGGGVPKDFHSYQNLLKRGYHPGLSVQITALQRHKARRSVSVTLQLQNKHAGHWLPTADPERFLLFHATVYDAKNKQLERQSLRIGQTWKWEPMAQKIGDNRLKPGETRQWSPTLKLPSDLPGSKLVVLVYHVRLSSHTARYMVQHAPQSRRLSTTTRKQIAKLGYHYPLATLLYREDIELTTGKRRSYSIQELLKLSYQERFKPLTQRDY